MTNRPTSGFGRSRQILLAVAVVALVLAPPVYARTKASRYGRARQVSGRSDLAPNGELYAAEVAGNDDFYSDAAMLTDCTALPDGTACDDGNACTVGETCRAGNCAPPVSVAQAAGSPIAVGTTPLSIAVGDMNADGRLDFAVANFGSNNVTILLGNGSGGFSQAAGSPITVSLGPVSVAAGDWNGDGRLDLAVARNSANNVAILLGNGSGGFSPAVGSPVAVGPNPISVAVGDWNGDATRDLAVANNSSNNVTILLGNGAGGFAL